MKCPCKPESYRNDHYTLFTRSFVLSFPQMFTELVCVPIDVTVTCTEMAGISEVSCTHKEPPPQKKKMMLGSDVLSRKKIKAIVGHGTDGKGHSYFKQSGKYSRKR